MRRAQLGVFSLVFGLFALSHTPSLAQDRTVFQYSDGSFQSLGNGQWIERNVRGTWNYREVRRTPAYVQLQDTGKATQFLLYAGEAKIYSDGDAGWRTKYYGSWQGTPAPAPPPPPVVSRTVFQY